MLVDHRVDPRLRGRVGDHVGVGRRDEALLTLTIEPRSPCASESRSARRQSTRASSSADDDVAGDRDGAAPQWRFSTSVASGSSRASAWTWCARITRCYRTAPQRQLGRPRRRRTGPLRPCGVVNEIEGESACVELRGDDRSPDQAPEIARDCMVDYPHSHHAAQSARTSVPTQTARAEVACQAAQPCSNGSASARPVSSNTR